MSADAPAPEAPPVTLGDANPWNGLRYGARSVPDCFALFPCEVSPDGVEARPAYLRAMFETLGAACVETAAQRLDHYLPLARVASAKTLAAKRAAYSASLAAARLGRDGSPMEAAA